VLLKDLVVLDGLVEALVAALDVARDNRESQILEEFAKLLVAAVPLVVAEGHGVELERVEVLCDLAWSVEGVEQRALELVARVEPQVVRVVFAKAVDCVLDARVAAKAALLGIDAVCARLCKFVEMRVDVVDVEEGYIYVSLWSLNTVKDLRQNLHML
jgi:hypothetical protein